MLNVTKHITLNGVSRINGQDVVYMSANLSTESNGPSNVTKTINNRELYNANKVEVRQDMADFEDAVYLIEDELVGGKLNETK